MPCFHPLTAWQQNRGDKLQFAPHEQYRIMEAAGYNELEVPCGQCIGCRLTRSRHWATRCMHEASMHKWNCYITLTYREGELAPTPSLEYRDWVLFMRRLRRRHELVHRPVHSDKPAVDRVRGQLASQGQKQLLDVISTSTTPPRFYVGGEYGPVHGRPHWHGLIFGLDFTDQQIWKTSPSGARLYTSATLDQLWGKGFATVGKLTFESAAYTARYVMQKRTGDGNRRHYKITDPETGEVYIKRKEFNSMSRKKGIGKNWSEKYASDVLALMGKVIVRGHKANAPRYYDQQLEKKYPDQVNNYKYARWLEATAHKEHQTPERLLVQELVQQAKTKTLARGKTK